MTFDALAKSRAKSRPVTLYLFQGDISTEYQLENQIHGVTMIPGTTEFGYGTTKISKDYGDGSINPENWLSNRPDSDFSVALQQLIERAPNLEHVSLVVAWHGNDLRIGECKIKPRVEIAVKNTTPLSWQVGPVVRSAAEVVSYIDGFPAIGGAPADWTVYEAITAMKAKGLRVTMYPFVMMDIPADNNLPNPYSDNAEAIGQSAYPWRGRITVSPAAGFEGSPDKTPDAETQVSAFFGSATAANFGWNSSTRTVTYSGTSSEWSFRRFILHMATIAKAAGADDFIVGSEMVGVTTIRSGPSTYPGVEKLNTLIDDVRAYIGSGTRLSYGADWSEYHSHRPGDGSGDVYFHLDPIWANPNVDFVGVDNYLPISDWREGENHLDLFEGWRSIYDVGYLEARIEGGENYDWYYANGTDRDNQVRTPITDGQGKPWVWRNKDFRNWWLNEHVNRPGGVEDVEGPNLVPNPNGTGATVGGSGLPSGWAQVDGTGLTRTVVAQGFEGGRAYTDIRFQGTITSGGSYVSIQFNTNAGQLPAVQGDVREASVHLSLVSGSLSTLSRIRFELSERNAAASGLVFAHSSDFKPSISSTPTRFVYRRTTENAAAVGYLFRLQFEINTGATVDFTIRVAVPTFRKPSGKTAWVPQSKPIVFTELGCPAVNKGANQPNLFIDPKSSESHYPHFSNHRRDTLTQRAMLEAWLKYWGEPGKNPVSAVYGKPMLEMESAALWTWDSRPYPTFPRRSDFWGDAASWQVGHWLNGRLQRVDKPVGKAPIFAYTDAERPFTFRGITYQPIPIRCGNVNASGKLDKSLFEVRVPRDAAIADLFRAYPPSQPISLMLRQGHLNDPDEEFLAVWTGRVLSSSREENETVFACEPTSSSLRRPGLRRNYQIGCPYVLYGAGCYANKDNATRTTSVSSMTATTVTLPSGWNGSWTASKFAQGMIEWTTDNGTKEIRRILRISGNTLTVSGLLRGLEPGQALSVILGCNHQTSDCSGLHNNIHNFGGCPTIPTKNPLSPGVNNFY
jgi:hypothetical protein